MRKTITESDWLGEWDEARKAAAESPPTGFYTLAQIAERLDRTTGAVKHRVETEVRSGRMELRRFLIRMPGGRHLLVAHYRAIAAPSAKTKPKPK